MAAHRGGRACRDLAHRIVENIGAAPANMHGGALGGERFADLLAEAAAAPRHENRLAGQNVVAKNVYAHKFSKPYRKRIRKVGRRYRKPIYNFAESCQGSSARARN